jgi:hypothetical protein
MTRRDRRACRLQGLVSDREARLAARLARLDYRVSGESGAIGPWDGEAPLPWWLRHLDYRVSGETGALRVHGRMGVRPRSEGRNGLVYVVKAQGLGNLAKPMTHNEWRRPIAAEAQDSINRSTAATRPQQG